jgi:hypothetical protein
MKMRKPVQVQEDDKDKEEDKEQEDNDRVRMSRYALVWDILSSESPYHRLIICSSHPYQ